MRLNELELVWLIHILILGRIANALGFHDVAKKYAPFNNTITSNATFKFDPVERKLVCCSSSDRAPNLKMLYCHHPLVCRGKERMLRKVSCNSWKFNNYLRISCGFRRLAVAIDGPRMEAARCWKYIRMILESCAVKEMILTCLERTTRVWTICELNQRICQFVSKIPCRITNQPLLKSYHVALKFPQILLWTKYQNMNWCQWCHLGSSLWYTSVRISRPIAKLLRSTSVKEFNGLFDGRTIRYSI